MNTLNQKTTRVRFAPSPTGFFHIGSARTALFNWLYAKHTGGAFILRIEDTDKARNTPEALRVLMEGMRWLGLDWDEGPEVGGAYGPYFQSQRDTIYKEYLQKLLKSGHAYEKEGAVWLKISGEPQIIEDAIRGTVVRAEEKDFVIFRSDGTPIFHFVNVVDDIAMAITHVIRGEDHLSNTSKHMELFKAFGAPVPIFAHIPLILKTEGPGKMSKRDKGALIEEYRNRYFLPQAVRNYLCLLGWSPKDDREIVPIEEIIRLFDLHGINKNNARFDEQKLSFINGEYLRHLPVEEFVVLVRPVFIEAGLFPDKGGDEAYLKAVLGICKEKVKSIEGLAEYTAYFFKDDFMWDEAIQAKVFAKGQPRERLQEVHEALQSYQDFTETGLERLIHDLAEKHKVKTSEYLLPLRFALSGQGSGPTLFGIMQVLDKERVINRIENFLKKNIN